MTTWTVTGKQSLLSLIGVYLVAFGKTLSREAKRRGIQIGAVVRLLFRVSLVLGARVAFTVSAWMVAVPLGLVVGGLSLLVFEWLVKTK